jgi:TRAP-type C4-dicarboxylate transport system permease small subunit
MSIRKYVDKIVDIAAGLSLAGVTILTFAQVVSRYVFKLPIPWSQDVIRLTFIYLVFLGATIGIREKAHLNIDVVLVLFKKKSRAVLEILTNLIICAFLIFLIIKGMGAVTDSLTQKMPYLHNMPISVLYLAIPVNGLLMLYYLIPQILEQIHQIGNVE